MTSIEHAFRRNFIVISVLHVALIAGIMLCEGLFAGGRKSTAALVELVVPADILGDLPKGTGQGRGAFTPPSQPVTPQATFAPREPAFAGDEQPAPQPKPSVQLPSKPNEIAVPKKPKSTAQKKPAQQKPVQAKATRPVASTGNGASSKVSANDIRNRFAKALQAAEGGTPYGDNKPAGGGSGRSARIGSPDGAANGVIGGRGKGTPFWWYYQHVHDKMYEAWEQPGETLNWDKQLISTVMIRVARDGTIEDVTMTNSSGNKLMDDSALAAARRVPKLDPLPGGLGGMYKDITVDFQLEG